MTGVMTPDAVGQLRSSFSGHVIEPDDVRYDDTRAVHNGTVDKRPALIACCRNSADIADAVRFGREHGLELSVRGGGHNVAGTAVCDGGLMIDLALMKGSYVDASTGLTRAQGGLTWREYNRATHAYGRATTGGVISTTGVAGLTLGGGLGWLMGKYGLAIDNLQSVELVTAEGDIIEVSEDADADLFWALRGGGGNFGVASSFQYRTHPLSEVYGGIVAYPLAETRAVVDAYRELTAGASDECTAFLGLVHAPDGSGTKIVAAPVCHIGSPGQAEREIRPLRSVTTPALDAIGPMPYPVVNTLLDDGFPKGARNYWKSAFFDELADGAVELMVDAFERAPSPMSGMVIEHFHGEMTRIPATAAAFPHREPGYNLVLAAVWMDPSQDEANISWARELMEGLAPFMRDSAYVNYLGADEPGSRVRAAYGPNWDRLVELKRRYDPDNVFHLNQNIDPAGA